MNQFSNANKPKIFVAGSSWARGEWVGPKVVHRGMIQYFEDDEYTVIDASQSRSYHSRAIENLDIKLQQHHTPGDLIFFVFADPLLDLIMPELAKLNAKRETDISNLAVLTEEIQRAGGLVNLIYNLQNKIYKQLDIVAKKYNTTVYCIGGTYNVNTNLLKDFDDLTALVVSWVHLLVGHFDEYSKFDDPEFGASYTWRIQYINFDQYNPVFADQVKKEFEHITKGSAFLKEDIFHPDGSHPNREGHYILFNHIKEKLKL